MEEEKFTIRIELVDIVESKLGIECTNRHIQAQLQVFEVSPSKLDDGLSKAGKFTSYNMKYGIDILVYSNNNFI